MRMILNPGTSDETIFEGSADELMALRKQILSESAPAPAPVAADSAEREFVSEEVAYRVLTRRPLSKEQRAVLSLLYQRDSEWVWATELQNKIGYSISQFSGLMGAFGRRFVYTEGYKDPTWFFDNVWDGDRECNKYRLPETVRAAMRRAKLA